MSDDNKSIDVNLGVQAERVVTLQGRFDRFEDKFDSLSEDVVGTQRQVLEHQANVVEHLGELKVLFTKELGDMRATVLSEHSELQGYVYKEVKPVVERVARIEGRIAAWAVILAAIVSLGVSLSSGVLLDTFTSERPVRIEMRSKDAERSTPDSLTYYRGDTPQGSPE